MLLENKALCMGQPDRLTMSESLKSLIKVSEEYEMGVNDVFSHQFGGWMSCEEPFYVHEG